MRLLIADYSGHPFQVQLSRALAARGHDVLHLFSASSETPKGELEPKPDDPHGFQVIGVTLDEPFDKQNFVKRRRQEIRIGKQFAEVVERFRPDVGVFANQPIDTLAQSVPALRRTGARFVFWLQDLLGEASTRVLAGKLGPPGALIGSYYSAREARHLRKADHVVAISDDFRPALDRLRIDPKRVSIIENWAPINDLPTYPRDNAWARRNLPPSGLRIIYSGTLGFKQDPEALLDVAAEIDCDVLIFSQGAAARSVAAKAAERGLANVSVRDWLDFADLPKALAGADLLAVLLEPDAGAYSVPSKVLTYMCVGRPVVGSIAADNLAARIITRAGAGIVCQPGDHRALVAAVRRFATDRAFADAAGAAARRYAEATFGIDRIADRFESVIGQACGRALPLDPCPTRRDRVDAVALP